jgi:pilus assembly protein CpaB
MAASGRKTGRIFILLAILLIVIFAGAFLWFRLQQQASPAPSAEEIQPTVSTETVAIVISAQSISRGSVITSDKVTTIDYPKEKIVEGTTFYYSVDEVVGKRAKYDLDAQVPLTASLVLDSAGSIPSFQIPAGMAAVPIPVTKLTAVSYAPQAGDHVMVIACMNIVDIDQEFQSLLPNNTAAVESPGYLEGELPQLALGITTSESQQGRVELDSNLDEAIYVVPSEEQRPRIVCQTVLQDAIVLKMGDFSVNGEETVATETPTEETGQEDVQPTAEVAAPDNMTLIVSPQDVVLLNYLIEADVKLTVALRSSGDSQTITTDAVTLQYVLDQKNIPLPVKLPYGIEPSADALAPTDESTPQ